MSKSKSTPKATRKRRTAEFKKEALDLAKRVGVAAAAKQLGLQDSQLYSWRSRAQLMQDRGEADREMATELQRLKRQLAEREEEVAILRKAAAYFAKGLK